jgi:hypothetical protein
MEIFDIVYYNSWGWLQILLIWEKDTIVREAVCLFLNVVL